MATQLGGRSRPVATAEALGRLRRPLGFAVGLLMVGTVVSACGSSGSPGVASLGSTTTTQGAGAVPVQNSGQVEAGLRRYAGCMETHGEPGFPSDPADDPKAMNAINQNSPQYKRANTACEKDLVHQAPPSPAEMAAEQVKELKWVRCMQTHGEPSWPDPFPKGGFMAALSGSAAQSPVYKKAISECKALWP